MQTADHISGLNPACRKNIRGKIGELLKTYSFLAPAYVIFIFFIFIPVLRSFYLSFFDYSLLTYTTPKFVGLANFQELLQDRIFWISVSNTLVYAVGTVPFQMALGLMVALLLNNKLAAQNFYRASYFMPVITSMVAAAIIWALIFDASSAGMANRFLSLFRAAPRGWLADSKLAMFAVVIMSIWKDLGYCMLIYLAGLQGIPLELYEAASIDGATKFQQFFRITLPLLKPTTFFILTTQSISAFQVFTQTYVMTEGGPGYSTTTLINLLYTKGFQEYNMGYASVLAVVLFIAIMVLTVVQKRLFRSDETLY